MWLSEDEMAARGDVPAIPTAVREWQRWALSG